LPTLQVRWHRYDSNFGNGVLGSLARLELALRLPEPKCQEREPTRSSAGVPVQFSTMPWPCLPRANRRFADDKFALVHGQPEPRNAHRSDHADATLRAPGPAYRRIALRRWLGAPERRKRGPKERLQEWRIGGDLGQLRRCPASRSRRPVRESAWVTKYRTGTVM
jgi:hypothetical protein